MHYLFSIPPPHTPTLTRAYQLHPDKVSGIYLQGANPAWIGPFELLSEEELRWWKESMFGARAFVSSWLCFQTIIEKSAVVQFVTKVMCVTRYTLLFLKFIMLLYLYRNRAPRSTA